MTDLSHEARVLIETARAAEQPPGAVKAKVRVALAARLAPLPGSASGGGKAALPTKVAAGSLAKLTLVSALAVVVSAGLIVASRHWGLSKENPRDPQSPARAALPPETTPARARLLPEPSPQAGKEPGRATIAKTPTLQRPSLARGLPAQDGRHGFGTGPAAVGASSPGLQAADHDSDIPLATRPSPESLAGGPTGCSTREELRLLTEVQTALRDRRGHEALELLDRHAAACPGSRFGEEHSAAHILALCLVHRRDEALRESARLAIETPKSPQLARLRSSCAAAALTHDLPDRVHGER